MKFSATLPLTLSLFALTASATQKTEIRNCGTGGGPKTSPITGFYDVFDDGESVCVSRSVEVDWNAGASFEVQMYGTRCAFHTETTWSDVANGDKFGYVNCPGMSNIPAIRDETDYSGWCWSFPFGKVWGCRNRAKMEWDGCLSCGDALCFDNADCPSTGCCDKGSNICSTAENSACMD